GEGADELLGGYGRIFRSAYEYEKRKVQNISFYHYFMNEYEYVLRSLRDEFVDTEKSLRNYFDEIISQEFKEHCNNQNIFRYFQRYHIQSLSQRIDVATSSQSLIARTPFLDYELVEFVYKKVPYSLKLKWK